MDLAHFKDYILITQATHPGEEEQEFGWRTAKMCDVNKVEAIKLNTYVPASKDKLFFFEGCNVPRYKVRDWGKKNDATVTIKPDTATALFARKTSIYEYLNHEYVVRVNKISFLSWLDKNYNIGDGNISVLYKEVEDHPENIVYLGGWLAQYKGKEIRGCLSPRKSPHHPDSSYKMQLVSFDMGADRNTDMYEIHPLKWDALTHLVTNSNVCSQESLISYINENAAIITEEYFEELRVMLGSEQTRDKVLALEIMASCQIEPSMHYVLLLMKEFSNTIYAMKEHKHVNFKSLMDFLGLPSLYLSDDMVITTLMKHNLLTPAILKETAIKIKDRWINEYGGVSNLFKISKIEATDVIKDYFKEQLKKQQQEQLEIT